MKKSACISLCSVAILTCALRTDSLPPTFRNQPQLPTLEPCVAHLVSPNYPQIARQTWIQGKVTASVLVYRDGTASVAKEGKGHPLLLGAAQENLKTWRFRPNDSAEAIPLDVEYEFLLDTERPTDDSNSASMETLDLPRHVTVFAPARKVIVDVATITVKKKHWWQFWK